MKPIAPVARWGVLWRSENQLDGKQEHIMCEWQRSKYTPGGMPVLLHTRREARSWIEERYGYIADRPDLRTEPHGWKMPIPIKVKVTIA